MSDPDFVQRLAYPADAPRPDDPAAAMPGATTPGGVATWPEEAGAGTAGRNGRVRATLSRAVAVALIVAVSGAVVGWLWAGIAPRLAVVKVDGGYAYADSEPEQAIAGDGWFAILSVAAGVVFAVLAWFLLRRHRGVAVLVGLVTGSLLGSLVAWWVGHRIGLAQFHHRADSAALGTRLNAPLGLHLADVNPKAWWRSRPTGVAAVQALIAAVVYTSFAGFSVDPALGGPVATDPTGPDQAGPDQIWPDQAGPGLSGPGPIGPDRTGTDR
jgi:hypothetical protein